MTTLTLPALAFLLAISGIPGMKSLPWFKSLVRHKPHPTAADSLPPHWKSASRLALERDFIRAGLPGFGADFAPSLVLQPGMDPRKIKTSMDPDSGVWTNAVEVGEVRLGAAYRQPLSDFGTQGMREAFDLRWRARSRQDVNHSSTGVSTVTQHTGMQFALPVNLPPVVSSILGPGGPALNVSGSESIRLSGTSNWTNQQTGILGQKRSLFPSLDMQQDLNIQLEGQLSDRVKVNMLQNSANPIPLSNRIAINYKGDEDDLIQGLDLGNTSLALPGTQYVSYSGRNEGLFGIKLATRVGPLDWTVLASKQEGRSERASYSGGASVNNQFIADMEYEKGRYFLLYDPLEGDTLYTVDDRSINIFRDDANYANDNNPALGKALVDPDTVMHVNTRLRRMGVPISTDKDTAAVRGRFDLLKPVDDYEILPDYYVFQNGVAFKIIRLKQPATGDMTIAATYLAVRAGVPGAPPLQVGGRILGSTKPDGSPEPDSARILMKLLRAPRFALRAADPGNLSTSAYDDTSAFDAVRELEMKNFYQLSGFQIDPKSFNLQVQRGTTQPPRNFATNSEGIDVNYIEALGLDNLDESMSTAQKGHDGKVDGTGYASGVRSYVDFANGVVWFPEPRPFAPRIGGVNGTRWFDQVMDQNINRRVRMTGPADSSNSANRLIYDKYNADRNQDPQYFISAEYAAQRGGGDITLGRGNLLENSEAVTVNGERWTRDRDYTIDYDLGRLTLKRNLGPTDQFNVDYSYAPLFAQAGKTLLGSAFRLEGRDRSLGGAFVYESRGAQDLRPRLGEEPARTLITDLNSDFRFKPSFLTRFADRLPGVHTSAPSDLTVQAEVGASFPNPNTRNVVYIDDTEGVRDAVSLTLSADRWRLSSEPRRWTVLTDPTTRRVALADTLHNIAGESNAELHWYMPPNYVKERDLKPNLNDAQGAQNPRQVLALSVPRLPLTAQSGDSVFWAGLTYQLDEQGLDLSRSQFIEVWLNDFNDNHDPAVPRDNLVRGAHVQLHIDLGTVSEDQMRAPNRRPDGLLQSEDKPPRDHQLTVTDNNNEDTGYDGLLDAEERARYQSDPVRYPLADLSTANPDDPEGDDYGDPDNSFKDIDPRKFRRSNGTEGNKKLFPYPDTEDLNLNENLDRDENYYEYTVDLSDGETPYLETDLQDLRRRGLLSGTITDDNGWRRYRIPITDSLRVQFGSPDLSQARHVRVWMDHLKGPEPYTAAEAHPLMMIGGFDIVGSRWVQAQLTPSQRDTVRTTMTLNSVNSVDNADVYVPPFDPGKALTGSQSATRREQSLSLEFTDLAATDTLEAYRTFSISEDYSRYGNLTAYVAAFDVAGYDAAVDSTLFYFVRFASDERGDNYYEVRRHLPRSSSALAIQWQELKVSLAEISNFKLAADFPKADPILYTAAYGAPGDSVVIRGRPSFTRLRRISIGLLNDPWGTDPFARKFARGQLWFDELRATDIAKDVGVANRVQFGGHVANLASFNLSWNARDADFLSVGETRGSGSRTTNLAVTSSVDTHRFFEGTGIQLPVSLVYNQSVQKPRFSAGDDVVRTGAQQDASQTRSTAQTISTSYSRAWGDRSNPLLRYSIGGLTANASRTISEGISPTGKNEGVSSMTGLNWGMTPRNLLKFDLPFGKAKFFPLPERISANYQSSQAHNTSYTRSVDDPTRLQLSNDVSGRVAGLDLSADTRPFDFFTHHIDARRALTLSNVQNQRLAGLNIGRTTSWRQTMGARYTLKAAKWLRPSISWGSGFSSNADLQSQNLSVNGVGNNQTTQVNWEIPLDQMLRPSLAPPPRAEGDSTGAAPRASGFEWRPLLAKVGNIQTDYSLTHSSSFSRLLGAPSLLYVAGLSDDPGLADGSRVSAANGNSGVTGVDWRANARTRINVAFGSGVNARLSVGDRTSTVNGVATRQSDTRFPDLDFDFGKLSDVLRVTKLLQQPQLRTSWVRQTTSGYRGTATDLQDRTVTDEHRPLLSMRGNLRNGTQADLSVNLRGTTREIFQYGTSTTTDNNSDLNLTLSRSYSAGQEVVFLGKTRKVRTSGSMQLATVYSHHTGETHVSYTTVPSRQIDESRLSVTGTGSYGFSSTLTGSGVLGFSQNKDKMRGIVNRSVRVELRAQFSF